MTPRRLTTFAALISLALAASALGAEAPAPEVPTREEYVTRLEAICKPDNEATERATEGARTDLRKGRYAVVGAKFAKAARIFGGSVSAMKVVPRPPADQPKLSRWFGFLDDQEAYLGEMTREVKAKHAIKTQRLITRFVHSGNLANSVVLPFGFNACTFKFSRYG